MRIVRPTFPDLNDFAADFAEALDNGRVTNNGEHVQEFERALTEYLDCPTLVFSSGQTALMTMLAAAGVKDGDVICPSFTFCGTPHAIEWAGAMPIFSDIDDTLCLDGNKIRCSRRTKAILAVEPYGIRCDSFLLAAVAKAQNIPLLIDSAPAFGSHPIIDTESKARIFSFHATKPFSTMEGGALCSHDPEFFEVAAEIRNFGQDDKGDCFHVGLNGKMMEVCALIGRQQLKSWPATVKQRNANAILLADELSNIEGVRVVATPKDQRPIWTYFPILITEDFGKSRDAVMVKLAQKNIQTRKYYLPAHQMTCYQHMNCVLPVTDMVAAQVISLPFYSDMERGEIAYMAESIRQIQSE